MMYISKSMLNLWITRSDS